MTEGEWLAGADVQAMTLFARKGGHIPDPGARKWQLFACAACRAVWPLLWDARSREAVEVAERFADGAADAKAMRKARKRAGVPAFCSTGEERQDRIHAAQAAEMAAGSKYPFLCWDDVANALAEEQAGYGLDRERAKAAASARLCALLRDILGNPYRPAAVNAATLAWNDGIVRKLAQSAYDGHDPASGTLDTSRLAVLSDALEEAGCSDAAILGHLRSPGPHVRGCFALDLLLGKS